MLLLFTESDLFVIFSVSTVLYCLAMELAGTTNMQFSLVKGRVASICVHTQLGIDLFLCNATTTYFDILSMQIVCYFVIW